MKLLLPLLATSLFVTACSSPDASRRALWADSSYVDSAPQSESHPGRRPVWRERTYAESHAGRWEPTVGFSDPNATRRVLYSDARGSGPYTNALADGSWRGAGKPVDAEMKERHEEQESQRMLNKTHSNPALPEPAPL